jgi:DNA-binding transcriptional ArsR family regulator
MTAPAKPLSGRPLYGIAADQPLYVPRPELEARLQRSMARDLNTLVVGERGAGKTTLLQRALFDSGQRDGAPQLLYLDASIARSALDVIDLLRDRLGVAPHTGENVAAGFRSVAKPGATGARDATILLDRLRPLRQIESTVVLLDGLDSAEIAHTLFGRLRDELWALPLAWVVTVQPENRSAFLTPPADAFFEVIIELGPFAPQEQAEMLKRRLPDEWIEVQGLVGKDRGNPRQLLGAARQTLVEGRPIDDVLRALAMRRNLAAQLGRAPSTMLSELEALDRPVAASDAELLRRLGVTRERAGQVLNQLEHAGLVDSFHEPAERGRPRKLYRVRDILTDGKSDASG